jgi:hypothetical protein
MSDAKTAYPGDRASARDIRLLAEEYHHAAHRAAGDIRPGEPLSAAPLRLLALHAVELNLSACLLLDGLTWPAIRRMGHDVGARLEAATAAGLVLRRRTAAHLVAAARDREYLISRYGPDCQANVSQVSRLLATLDEVGRKVGRTFEAADWRVASTIPAGELPPASTGDPAEAT